MNPRSIDVAMSDRKAMIVIAIRPRRCASGRWRGSYTRYIGYNQYIILIYNLVLADFQQSLAFIMMNPRSIDVAMSDRKAMIVIAIRPRRCASGRGSIFSGAAATHDTSVTTSTSFSFTTLF
jgi:hypothetical protein